MRTCRKILLVAAAVFAAAHGFCGTGATQTWVSNYVSNYVAQTRSELESAVEITSSSNQLTMTVGGYTIHSEEPTERALLCTADTPESSLCGITNGMVFAETEAGWRSRGILIHATRTNMWFEARGMLYEGAVRDGAYWLVGTNGLSLCGFASALISKTYAAELEVEQ